MVTGVQTCALPISSLTSKPLVNQNWYRPSPPNLVSEPCSCKNIKKSKECINYIDYIIKQYNYFEDLRMLIDTYIHFTELYKGNTIVTLSNQPLNLETTFNKFLGLLDILFNNTSLEQVCRILINLEPEDSLFKTRFNQYLQ